MRRKPEECVRVYATSPLIRSLVQLSGLTVDELATRVGVSASTAHSFISGKLVDTSAELAQNYADALGVSVDLLFIKRRSTLPVEELARPGVPMKERAA